MLHLKLLSKEDLEAAHLFFSHIPSYSCGVYNPYRYDSLEKFKNESFQKIEQLRLGEDLKEDQVQQSYFMLWLDDLIIGLFKIRHHLNENLIQRGGHLSYIILAEFQNQGYGSKGLALAIEEAKNIILEDELYMNCYKFNRSSLRIMMKNGAYIHHEDDETYHTRIKIRG